MVTELVLAFAQAGLAVFLAPGLVGLIRWIKARLQSRARRPTLAALP
jgi:formate hydrogenlyase subunit 4